MVQTTLAKAFFEKRFLQRDCFYSGLEMTLFQKSKKCNTLICRGSAQLHLAFLGQSRQKVFFQEVADEDFC